MSKYRRNRIVFYGCALGLSLDLAEYAIGSVLAAFFILSSDPGDKAALTWLLSSVYAGGILGASISGLLADIYGRRRIFIIIMLLIFVTSVGGCLAPDATSLTAIRFVSGMFLGAYPPLMSTYLAETTTATKRGRLYMNVVALGACGPVLITFLVHYLSQSNPFGMAAWRWAFLVCGFVALLCSFIFMRMPESPKWLRLRGLIQEAEDVEQCLNIDERHWAGPTTADLKILPDKFLLVVVYLLSISFIITCSTIGFPLLIGSMFIAKGVSLQSTLLFTGLASLGYVAGAFVAGTVIDKFERKSTLLAMGVLTAGVMLVFNAASSPIVLIICSIIFKMLVAIILPLLTVYISELVPTLVRGRVTSLASAARGAGAALVPFLLLPVLERFGVVGMSIVITSSLVLFLAIVTIFGPRGNANRAII
ncbi:MFS transporter [Labrys sp. La1]|uniref:MFS transporter n=1 Tax=Labrys sp. La1 TaxID=3404917 RepID=UPI003EBFBFEA